MSPKTKQLEDCRLLALVRRNLELMMNACYLASEWEITGADADKDSDPKASAKQIKRAGRYLRMERNLKKYLPKE